MDTGLTRLAMHPFHVAAGDVLLLRGAGKGWHNLASQSAIRGRRARYTHVAVVLDGTLVADTMPGKTAGVRIRPWRELEPDYDLGRSRVARNRSLAAAPDGHARVYRSALYFVKQPYRLGAAIIDAGSISDQSGLVCSHFVAAVLERAGVTVSSHPPTATLPVDMDEYTLASADWWQFPLGESGLHSATVRPPPDDPYWRAALDHVTALQTPPVRVASKRVSRGLPRGEVLARAQAVLQQHDPDSAAKAMADLVASTVREQYRLSRLIASVDRSMVLLAEAVASGHPAARVIAKRLLSLRAGRGAAEMTAITGAQLQERLEALYGRAPQPGVFLHEDEHAAEMRTKHRLLLRDTVLLLRDEAEKMLATYHLFPGAVSRLADAIGTQLSPRQAIRQAVQAGQMLLDAGGFLRAESPDVLAGRLAALDSRREQFIGWLAAAQLSQDEVAVATETFNAMVLFDVDAQDWQREVEPELRRLLDRLQGLLPAGAGRAA